MKTTIFVSLFLLLFSIKAICQSCEDCRDEEFIYMFCKDGKKFSKCTSNPYNEPGLTLQKKCLPPSIIYNDLIIGEVDFYYDRNKDGVGQNNEIYFTLSEAEWWAYDALDWWKESCYPAPIDNTACFPCPLYILWSKNDNDFIGDFGDFSDVLAYHYQSYNSDCSPNCSENIIYINVTQKVIGWDPEDDSKEGFPTKRFFYTISDDYSHDPALNLYSFQTTITHEIGHWLGFKDQTGGILGGCGDGSGMMSEDKLEPEEDREISTDDRCMFMKIYCCPDEHNDVEEMQNIVSKPDFEIFPNPSNETQLILRFNELGNEEEKMLRITDLTGNTLISDKLQSGLIEFFCDVSKFPNG